MFCSKCGKQVSDNALFCNKCGNALKNEKQSQNGGQTISQATDEAAAEITGAAVVTAEAAKPQQFQSTQGRVETIVRQVPKQLEQSSINRYPKFGWKFLSNQEVNITEVFGGGNQNMVSVGSKTTTYVKLTFERNTGMRNFSILNQKYMEYSQLEDEYYVLYSKLGKKPISWSWFFVVGIIGTIISMLVIDNSYMDSFLLFMVALSFGIAFGLIGGWIGGYVTAYLRKNKYLPMMAELNKKMESIAQDAERYL